MIQHCTLAALANVATQGQIQEGGGGGSLGAEEPPPPPLEINNHYKLRA